MVRYRFLTDEDQLGAGGFGSVHPCCEVDKDGTVLNDQLAVKLCIVEDDEAPDEKYLRFRNGGRLGKRLRHPNVMPVIATGDRKRDGTPFIVMPRADGGNLKDWLAVRRSEEERVDVFRQVVEAIATAHGQRILHRDIKAENVLFLDGVPRVSDFDLAKDVDPETAATAITESNIGMGTRGYVAPEQCTDLKRVGPPADVYALGRLWWRMLTGRQPPHLSPLDLTRVPAQYRAFIAKASEYRPADRYGSATEMLRAFEALIAAPPGSPKQVAQELAERWNADEPHKHWRTLRRVDEHFSQHPDDEALHYELAPFLPPELLDAWMTEHPAGFAQMVLAVDEVCSGNLPWDDCDGFARFYLRIFQKSPDTAQRAKALEQVLRIGATHNRYPVANMLRGILADVTADDDVAVVVQAVKSQQGYAYWFTVPDRFDKRIVDVFAGGTDEDDDIPW